jgi:hypothetical protein
LPSWFGDHIAAAREGSPGDALEWDQYQQRLSPISAQSRRIYEHRHKALLSYRTAGGQSRCKGNEMNASRYYRVRVAGAKYGVGFGSALAITISYSANHSILWAIIHGILSWLYVIYFALFHG